MYTFPSRKKMSGWPVITIQGNPNRFTFWLNEHPEIDRRVPPVFMEFIIDANDYTIAVHYNESLTGYDVRLWYNNRTLMSGFVDYENINGETVALDSTISQTFLNLYGQKWMEDTCLATALTVIGVQAYILYFKPVIVEQIYAPQSKSTPGKPNRRINQQPIRIRQHKIKRITLSANDTPKKDVQYHKLSWHVRGHYKHVGKDKHLIYIQPHISTRGGKKYKASANRYEIADDTVLNKNDTEENHD